MTLISTNPSPLLGFAALAVTGDLHERLRAHAPMRHSNLRGEHITLKARIEESSGETCALLGQFHEAAVEFYGFADDNHAVQCFLARVNGRERDETGRLYHLTWSYDPAADVPGSYNKDGTPSKAEARHSAHVAMQERFVTRWPDENIIRSRLSAQFYPRPEWK